MASEGYHEPASKLTDALIDRHRAIVSIMEELEAVDWYDQRVEATDDESLAAVLAHNRDEEKEHAAMTIEWLRRQDPVFDRELRTYLFTDDPITDTDGHGVHEHPEGAAHPGSRESTDVHSLGIGSLKTRRQTEHP